jgi:DNA-binding MarR family transcriptional regulator
MNKLSSTANKHNYVETINILEELNKSFLESIKNNLEGKGIFDITAPQAMIIYRIYKNMISVGDIMKEGYYQGANVNYNLNKLLKNGYIHKNRNKHDARSFFITLSDKGFSLWDYLDSVIMSQANNLTSAGVDDTNVLNMLNVLGKIDLSLRGFSKNGNKN